MVKPKLWQTIVFTALASVTMQLSGGVALAAGKISLSPSAPTLSEGSTQVVSVHLDEPIIGPGPDPAYLHINLTSSDPSRVTLSAPVVNYTASDWFTIKTFTLSVLHDGVHNGTNTVTISFVAVSDSEYYSNYTGSVVVTIVDPDPAVTTTPVQVAPAKTVATLADTGADSRAVQAVSSLVLLCCIAAIARLLRRSHV